MRVASVGFVMDLEPEEEGSKEAGGDVTLKLEARMATMAVVNAERRAKAAGSLGDQFYSRRSHATGIGPNLNLPR